MCRRSCGTNMQYYCATPASYNSNVGTNVTRALVHLLRQLFSQNNLRSDR